MKFKNDYLSQSRTNFDHYLFILVYYYLRTKETENVVAYENPSLESLFSVRICSQFLEEFCGFNNMKLEVLDE